MIEDNDITDAEVNTVESAMSAEISEGPDELYSEEDMKKFESDVDKKLTHLSGDILAAVRSLILEYSCLFMKIKGEFPKTDLIEHTVDTGQAKPIFCKPARTPRNLQPVLDEFLSPRGPRTS